MQATGNSLDSQPQSMVVVYSSTGFVDASVVAIAERLRHGTIATTDRRHFTAIRPRHVGAFSWSRSLGGY